MPTNTSIPSPVCLHVPELRRGASAAILWEDNTGYELDWAVTRESDEGVTAWQTVEDAETDWLALEDDTWLTLEGRPEPEWEALYRRAGERSGEAAGDCLLAHAFHEAVIPGDAVTVQFRVRSYCGDQLSPYALSELRCLDAPDAPDGPEIGGSVSLALVSGREYHVQVNLRGLPDFADSVLALSYPADKLELFAATLDGDDFNTDSTEQTYASGIEAVSREPGVFRFRCVHEIPADAELSGLVACFRFTALADGDAVVSLG